MARSESPDSSLVQQQEPAWCYSTWATNTTKLVPLDFALQTFPELWAHGHAATLTQSFYIKREFE